MENFNTILLIVWFTVYHQLCLKQNKTNNVEFYLAMILNKEKNSEDHKIDLTFPGLGLILLCPFLESV